MGATTDELVAHSRWFDSLLNLVPARILNSDAEERIQTKFLPRDKREEAKQGFKAKYKENKKAQFDPDAPTSTVDLQKQQAGAKDSDADGSAAQPGPSKLGGPLGVAGSGQQLSREELKAKLQQKIEAIRNQRNLKDKQQVAKEAKEWKQKTLEDNAKQKQQQKQQQQQQQAGAKRKQDATPGSEPQAKAAHKQQQQQPRKQQQQQQQQHASSDGEDFQFAKLEFDDSKKHTQYAKKKPSKQELLAAAEAKRQEAAAAGANAEGKVKLVHDAWNTAVARASGEKVLDDPKLLRKSLKKETKRKEKSSKAWQERVQGQQSQKQARQDKRKENLQARMKGRVEKKIAKREKKLSRAGFEGRKSGFIGGDKK